MQIPYIPTIVCNSNYMVLAYLELDEPCCGTWLGTKLTDSAINGVSFADYRA